MTCKPFIEIVNHMLIWTWIICRARQADIYDAENSKWSRKYNPYVYLDILCFL